MFAATQMGAGSLKQSKGPISPRVWRALAVLCPSYSRAICALAPQESARSARWALIPRCFGLEPPAAVDWWLLRYCREDAT
jgi:hypothetical protein